ncbi:MAG: Helix-turn-helix domain [Acidobacteriota bacterium]|jgi:transcriptional regulator with XRE-family HTH domain|nr:Helix-turn-helix domain [Acidobacteriota bacterium]
MKPQTQHMIDVLRSVIRALGLTLREVETRLGVSRGYLTRLFSGVMDLRFDHVSEIAEAVGIEPDEILRLAFPPVQKPANAAALRVREVLGADLPATPPPPPPPAAVEDSGEGALEKELERIVARTFRKMFAGLEK